MKQVDVTIMGQSYTLGCPDDGEAELMLAVASVEHEMSQIRGRGKVKARERIAVLAAINLAYQLVQRPGEPLEPAPRMSETSIDIDALILRVDRALSQDGQLL